jgi:hypothetical protein
MLQLIQKHAGNGAFEPEDVRILVSAFDDAWQQIQNSSARLDSDRWIADARNALAKYIIDEALNGERDIMRLRDGALLHYAKSTLRNAATNTKPQTLSLVMTCRTAT